jgi:hypothetical protein
MRALAVAIVLGVALAANQNDVRVHGRVITESGTPVRGAAVVLTTPNNSWTGSTNDEGIFDARGLSTGNYAVQISKTGFRALRPAAILNLKAGESRDVGSYVLQRGGAIAGRVIDGFGDPAVNARVSASRIVYTPPGTRSLRMAGTGTTNDLGEYRIFGLEPGTYFVVVGSYGAGSELDRAMQLDYAIQLSEVVNDGRGVAVTLAARLGTPRGSSTTFYPSSRRESDAQPVRLAAGEQRLGIDIVLAHVPLSRVTGRVTTSSGAPARNATVRLAGTDSAFAQTDAAGMFSILDVSHGAYVAHASLGGNETASVPLTVSSDVLGLEIRLSPAIPVRGRLLIDGVGVASTPSQRLSVRVIPLDGQLESHFLVNEFVSGGFGVPSPPGRVRLTVDGLPTAAMISRITLNGFDVSDEGFEVSGPVSGVEIAITTTPGVVAGTITVPTDDRFSAVLVFSENPRFWTIPNTRYVKTAEVRSGPKGTEYRVSQLPAGRYLAVAVASFDSLTWADPENLAELRKLATPFTMPETGTVTVNLVRR